MNSLPYGPALIALDVVRPGEHGHTTHQSSIILVVHFIGFIFMSERALLRHRVLSDIVRYHTSHQAILQHVGLLDVHHLIPEDAVLVVLIGPRVSHMQDMRFINLRGNLRLVIVTVCGGSVHVSITLDYEFVFEFFRAGVGFVFLPILRNTIKFLFENIQQYLTHLPLLLV